MSKHTLGPWSEFGPGNPQVYGGDPKQRICVLDRQTGAPMDEYYANARLIAAAPDLLAALKEAELVLAEKLRRLGADPNVSPTTHRIRAAIAKATGEQA